MALQRFLGSLFSNNNGYSQPAEQSSSSSRAKCGGSYGSTGTSNPSALATPASSSYQEPPSRKAHLDKTSVK